MTPPTGPQQNYPTMPAWAIPAATDWMNPNQPDPLVIGQEPPDEPVTITRAQLDDLKGLVSDVQSIAAQLENQLSLDTVKFLDSPLTATNWEAFGHVQAYATTIELLRWALRSHPSVAAQDPGHKAQGKAGE